MEFLLEEIFGLIFEGIIEGAKSKKVPMAVRIICAIIILAIMIFVIGLFFFIAYSSKSVVLWLIAIGITLFFVIGSVLKYRKYKK